MINEQQKKDADLVGKGCVGMMSALSCVLFGLFFAIFIGDEIIGLVFVIIGGLIGIYLYMQGGKVVKESEEQQKKDEESIDETLEKF